MIRFEINQQVGKKISQNIWKGWFKKVEKILNLKSGYEVSVAIVNSTTIKKLNKIYRGKNEETDVLSFAERDSRVKAGEKDKNYLGEIIICYSKSQKQATISKHSISEEIELLFVHGFLHLLGYDHCNDKDERKMKRIEAEIIN